MKLSSFLTALLLFAIPYSSFAKAVVRHEEWDGKILVLTYNNQEMRFLGWTPNAKYFWENGTLPKQEQDMALQEQINSLIRAVNKLNQTLVDNNDAINRQRETIQALERQIAQQNQSIRSLRSRASTHIWTDVEGNHFVGTLIDYNSGVARIQKHSDGVVYSIPQKDFAPESVELAIALNQMR